MNNDTLIKEVMQKRLTIRDKRSELKATFDAKDSKLKEVDEKLQTWLLDQMQTIGTTTIKNEIGTAYISPQTKVSCADWPLFWEWCGQHNRLDMLEKRVALKPIKEYIEETGALPPAINISTERTVYVRRN